MIYHKNHCNRCRSTNLSHIATETIFVGGPGKRQTISMPNHIFMLILAMTDEKKLLILKRALEQLQEEDPSKPSNPTKEVYESLSRICGTRADDLEDLWDNRDFKEEAKVNSGRSACTVPGSGI